MFNQRAGVLTEMTGVFTGSPYRTGTFSAKETEFLGDKSIELVSFCHLGMAVWP